MKVHERHIIKEIYLVFLSVEAVVSLLFIMVSAYSFLPLLGKSESALAYFLYFVLLKIPSNMTNIMPLAVFFGIYVSMKKFSDSYEISAIQSAGISRLRVVRGIALWLFLPIFIVVFFLCYYVIPWFTEEFQNVRTKIAIETMFNLPTPDQFILVGDYALYTENNYGNGKFDNFMLASNVSATGFPIIRADQAEWVFEDDGVSILLKSGEIIELEGENDIKFVEFEETSWPMPRSIVKSLDTANVLEKEGELEGIERILDKQRVLIDLNDIIRVLLLEKNVPPESLHDFSFTFFDRLALALDPIILGLIALPFVMIHPRLKGRLSSIGLFSSLILFLLLKNVATVSAKDAIFPVFSILIPYLLFLGSSLLIISKTDSRPF